LIEQMQPWYGHEERDAMYAYLLSGGWLAEHNMTELFESRIAAYVESRYCVATTSGTAALFLALQALGIGEDDEVLVPALTQTATAGAVELSKATPVLVDIDPTTLCMDIVKAEQAITPYTVAMMVVSLNGRCPDMGMIQAFAEHHKLYIIEDAAQSLGSKYKGRHLGTFGDVGCYSLSSPKVITTGQGGLLVTDDAMIASKARDLKNFGNVTGTREFGVNFKFTDLQAVIGLEQLKKLAWRIQRKREMFALYQSMLEPIGKVEMLSFHEGGAPWFIDILVPDPGALGVYLKSRGIGTRAFYTPLRSGYLHAEHASEHGLWLPSGSYLTDTNIHRVCSEIRTYYTE